MKEAQALPRGNPATTGATTVPGTWTGRAPKYEVINGITVPPEPAPSINNATLAGVDVNNNGVRDDVERLIAQRKTTNDGFAAGIKIAQQYQKLLINPSITQSDSDVLLLTISCASLKTDNTLTSRDVQAAILKTPERLAAFRKKTGELSGIAVDPDIDCK